MIRPTTTFECQSCGYSSAKWLGRCPDCGSWNSFMEEKLPATPRGIARGPIAAAAVSRLADVSTADAPRVQTGNAEFDRVLGGGIVPGSVVLLGGEPGVGKSTLLLQVAGALAVDGNRVLYVSGEESAQQIKMRAERLSEHGHAGGGDIFVAAESSLEKITAALDEVRPAQLIIDSIQTTFAESLDSAPGSVSQVRHVATQLLNVAKSRGISVFLIGHVTKDGSIAGPKALEHIVDAVLYFEGERHQNHRIIRAVKNRFGAANEVGIFEMTSLGLTPVQNPSGLFLRERASASPGSAVVCALEGTRPMLVEVQALVIATQYGTARRTSTGVDYNRVSVLVAMLEKRLGIPMVGCDIYLNAAGGLEIDEPASDAGICAAILSSFRNRPIQPDTVIIGELGLGGEVRPVPSIQQRVKEAALMRFRHCIVPKGNIPLPEGVEETDLIPVASIAELSETIFGNL